MILYKTVFITVTLLISINHAAAITIRDVAFNTKSVGTVIFSHTGHINKKGLSGNCRGCHDDIFDLKNKKHYSMADMMKGKSCGKCHDGKKIFGIDKCVKCHPVKDITFSVKETGTTVFSHKIHLATADCSRCHPSLYSADGQIVYVGMAAMEKGKSCGFCHNSRDAFSVKECAKCHPTEELIFKDKNLGDVLFSHKFHTSLYNCGDCHTSIFNAGRNRIKVSMQEMANGKSCGACHNGKSAFTVNESCKSCHKM
ncbi:MAG: cytochrome c3 family protein [Desulfuromonadaceae bacterium]|nr:cytochrome c3 family protein [Desulfuromonadaceae bacterium]MDD2855569.1 cytochrome c3 family protein [Desulfuromonadaceae bacterium]